MPTRYEQIARQLREDIRSGRFQVGEPIPSERALADRFDVAPGTMRQALNQLVDEGTLSSKRGARKVVLRMPARFPEISKFRSFAQWAYGRGRTPGGHVIHQEWVEQTDKDAELLRVPAGEWVLKVLRVRTIDGSPIMLERTRYPAWVGTKVEPMDPTCPSVTNELAPAPTVTSSPPTTCSPRRKPGRLMRGGCPSRLAILFWYTGAFRAMRRARRWR